MQEPGAATLVGVGLIDGKGGETSDGPAEILEASP